MGHIRIQMGSETLWHPLASSTLVGRHWSADIRIPHPSVPLRWLEIRWATQGWKWRPLSGEERTRGSGASQPDGWRLWGGAGKRILLDGSPIDITLELDSPEPPELFLRNEQRGTLVNGADLDTLLRTGEDGRVYAHHEPERPLKDGELIVFGGEAHRVYIPTRIQPTTPVRLHLAQPDVWLGIARDRSEALFSSGGTQVTVRGACIPVLATYAHAVVEGAPWLLTEDAHANWVAKGGTAGSPIDRLAWERSKLRQKLAAKGAAGVDALFTSRRKMEATETRLNLEAHQISLDE